MISGLPIRVSIFSSLKRATFSGSKLANALRYHSPLFEHRQPTQSSLGTLQNEKLKLFEVIVERDSPLGIVVLPIQVTSGFCPGTSLLNCRFSFSGAIVS